MRRVLYQESDPSGPIDETCQQDAIKDGGYYILIAGYKTVMRDGGDLFCRKVAFFYRDAAAVFLRPADKEASARLRYPELRLAGRMSRLARGRYDQRQPTCARRALPSCRRTMQRD